MGGLLLLLPLLLRNWGCATGSELAFVREPGDVVAVRERPLVLPCQVEGEPPVSISWQRDGLALANDSGTTLMPDGSLRLAAVAPRRSLPSPAQEYHCVAQNRYGLLVSRRARVQLARLLGAKPREGSGCSAGPCALGLSGFHRHPESVEVEQGGVARFQCLIRGVPEPSISWEHNGTALSTADRRVTLLPGGILHITSVSQADVGTYRCVARNVANTRHSQDARLTLSRGSPRLLQEPEILSGPQNLTLTVHQTAVLECIATGRPRPLVSWSRLDGRSIGVEGIQVLGTGNLIISDVSVQHSGIYVCAANRPGTRVRRTAQGVLLVQAPPEFVQWPQPLSKPPGSSAIFTCVAQGVPEPRLVWLKNGKVLNPGDNIRLTHNNSTLMLVRVSAEDEAIYQCVAENSAGSNQASARLAVTGDPEPPPAPRGLQAMALSSSAIRVSWEATPSDRDVIGYALHLRPVGEPAGPGLQEAVGGGTFEHVFSNLEPATAYSIQLRAYSAEGASQDSASIHASTMGSTPAALGFSTTVLNATSVQASWQLPPQPGPIQGFKLFHRKLPAAHFEGPLLLSSNVSSFLYTDLEPAAFYEMKLQAFNGNGDGDSSAHFVSLHDVPLATAESQAECLCSRDESSPLPRVVVGVHVGLAAIIVCLLCLLLGWRHR
ncbi:immunoglobulin superfamily DCC subclass member 3-like [Rhinolophus ferrumequinum]|uniref:immunoglobulin superfamily DCC subclass member 3-like n=1 Tax=Rhinolophus ferrumequinum TaxID=59479 RepID=UPI00140F64FA|nr:immunoglobulin superfamily DCC subclass member 3-like [Rhinolophus ferrumequinum]